MISQLLRDISRGFGRSIGWKIGALLVLAVLAFFSNSAKAQTQFPSCQTQSTTGECDTQQEAAAVVTGLVVAYGDSGAAGDPASFKQYNKTCYVTQTSVYIGGWIDKSYSCTAIRLSGDGYGVYQRSFTRACPVEQWDAATGVCREPCDPAAAPLLGGFMSYTGSEPAYQTCVNGCTFNPDSMTYQTGTVDGVKYVSLIGWIASGAFCTAGANDNYIPPSDTDKDGTSDGNDSAPNNPGKDGQGTDGPSAEDTDGTTSSGGGGNCSSPPSSTGDAILAQIAYQTWATRCAIENSKNADGSLKTTETGTGAGGGTGAGSGTDMGPTNGILDGIKAGIDAMKDFFTTDPGAGATTGEDATAASVQTETEYLQDGLDASGFGYSSSCPAPIDISVMGNSIQLRTDILCDWLAVGGWFVMLLTAAACLRAIGSA